MDKEIVCILEKDKQIACSLDQEKSVLCGLQRGVIYLGCEGYPPPTVKQIVNGEITVTGENFIAHKLQSETGTSDELTKINGGQPGWLLKLEALAGHSIAAKKTDYIKIQADNPLNSEYDLLVLECKEANVWREVSRSSNE